MLDSPVRAVALISYHASPLGHLGRGENGGMNLAIRRLCEGLSAAGVPTDVFVRREDPLSAAEELIAPRSRLIRISAGGEQAISKADAREHVEGFARAVIEHALSERRRYRLIHAHYWLGGLVAQTLQVAWNVPWVQSFHTLAAAKLAAGVSVDPRRADTERDIAGAADLLLAASHAEAGDLVRLYGVPPTRVSVVPPGVDLGNEPDASQISQLRTRLGLEGRRVILFAGRLEPLKGIDLLFESVAKLTEGEEFADTVCLVAGDNSGDGGARLGYAVASGGDGAPAAGGERGRLEAVARELGIADRVRFVGAVEHSMLPTYYRLADVCVVPSRTETFGFVALEAQAAGTPVIAAAVGGLAEVVHDGVTGFLVPTREPAAFAARLAEVLGDAELRARMGEAAHRRAQGFTWPASVERLRGLYDRVTTVPEPLFSYGA